MTAPSLALALVLTSFQDPAAALAEGRARAVVEVDRQRYWVGEVIPVRLRVEVDRAWFERHGVPLFPRELDVPVQVLAPWFEALDGAARIPDGPDGVGAGDGDGARASIAVGGEVFSANRLPDVTHEGRVFAVFAVERRFRVDEPRAVELTAPRLRFAYATAFVDDIVQGRTPVDRHTATVSGEPRAVQVVALPERGRPERFSGAVGIFTVRATASPAELAAGEQLQLELIVEGDGDLAAFRAPRLDDLPGFHVLGAIERTTPRRRTIVYDLEPRSASVTAVPAVALTFFDPRPPGRYRTAATEPVPIVVRAAARAAGPAEVGTGRDPAPERAAPGLADVYAASAMPGDRQRLPGAVVVAVVVGPWLLVAALWSRRRQHGTARRKTNAVAASPVPFAAAVARGEADLASHYAAFLAARLRSTEAAVIGDDLELLLARAGVPDELSVRALRLRDSLAAARYAGISAGAAVAALHVVEELAAAFGRAEDGS